MKDDVQRRIEYFSDRVFYWQRRLDFNEVEISVMEQIKPTARASCVSTPDAMMVSIFYSGHWIRENGLTNEEIDKVAFHEVFESMFHKINERLLETFSDKYVSEMIHEVVRKAENSIFPAMKEES